MLGRPARDSAGILNMQLSRGHLEKKGAHMPCSVSVTKQFSCE